MKIPERIFTLPKGDMLKKKASEFRESVPRIFETHFPHRTVLFLSQIILMSQAEIPACVLESERTLASGDALKAADIVSPFLLPSEDGSPAWFAYLNALFAAGARTRASQAIGLLPDKDWCFYLRARERFVADDYVACEGNLPKCAPKYAEAGEDLRRYIVWAESEADKKQLTKPSLGPVPGSLPEGWMEATDLRRVMEAIAWLHAIHSSEVNEAAAILLDRSELGSHVLPKIRLAYDRREKEEAEFYWREARRRAPNSWRFALRHARLLGELRCYDEANTAIEDAIRIRPDRTHLRGYSIGYKIKKLYSVFYIKTQCALNTMCAGGATPAGSSPAPMAPELSPLGDFQRRRLTNADFAS